MAHTVAFSTLTKRSLSLCCGSFLNSETTVGIPFALSFAVTVRTRNQELLKECDIVVDVGGLYDVDQSICMETVIVRKRFDHHQKEFKDTFDADHHTKLSSAGLV